MARILVADDNSNIQKMVGLALKDQGIDVVAVGNGEAAVRKIPDVRPDVVLADVFMPVRNGYEVCEFIKKNEKLSHIPVILLVGAFDPLDEQEAQRVGADGVLKKPFVPPDPLISMVKSALARAGANAAIRVSAGRAERAPSPAETPVISPFTLPPAEFASPEVEPEAPVQAAEDVPAIPKPFAIEEGHQPLAFGNLLDAKAEQQEAEADETFMPPRHTGLEEARKWNAPAPEDTEEHEEIPSWRSSIDELLDSAVAASTRPVSDWRDSVPSTPSQESVPEVDASPAVESTNPIEEPQPTSASPLPESAFTHWQEEPTSAPMEPASAETAEAEAPSGEPGAPPSSFTPENFPGLFVEEKATTVPETAETTEEPFVEQEFTPPVSPVSNWEEEVRRAARLVSTWETSAEAPQAASPSNELASPVPETPLEPGPAEFASSAFEPPTEDAVAKPPAETQWPSHPATFSEPAPAAQFDPPEWYRKFEATPVQEEQHKSAPAAKATEPAEAADMEALVAKVLERMNPDVLQQVTREILKPMVEALVREQLDKKK